MTEASYEFTRAITRLPAHSIVDGLRAEDLGNPDHAQMLSDHAHYVATLKEAGASVTELPAVEAYPDSVFVEDVALCLPEVAILMRPGAPSRLGEVREMAPVLRDVYDQVLEIDGPGDQHQAQQAADPKVNIRQQVSGDIHISMKLLTQRNRCIRPDYHGFFGR